MGKHTAYKNRLIDICDTLRGIVRSQDQKGNVRIDLMVEDEEGQEKTFPASGHWYTDLHPGTSLICTVRHQLFTRAEYLVNIDAVTCSSKKVTATA